MTSRRSFLRSTLASLAIMAATPAVVKAGDVFLPMVNGSPLTPDNISSEEVSAVINFLMGESTGDGGHDWLTHLHESRRERVKFIGGWIASTIVPTEDGKGKPTEFWSVFRNNFDLTPQVYNRWLDIIVDWIDGNPLVWDMIPTDLQWATEVMFLIVEKNVQWQPIQG